MVLEGTEVPMVAATVGARLGSFSYLLSMELIYDSRSVSSAVAL